MKVVTSEMMRELDRRAIHEAGIPAVVLMENAGRAIAEKPVDHVWVAPGMPAHVWCGTGNNGGDGFVAARYLAIQGIPVSFEVVGDITKLQGAALEHYRVLEHMRLPRQCPEKPFLKVDALLGTGLKGSPRNDVAAAIRRINELPGRTIAVDVPSGLDSDTGATPGEVVRAHNTITFGYPKLGCFLPPGMEFVGDIDVKDIGFDWDRLEYNTPYEWICGEDVARLLKPRARDAHKGDFGHVLVIGGSDGMSGAPTMAAKAAMAAARGGAGLVTVAAPESAQRAIAAKLNEVMTIALPEQAGALCEDSFDRIRPIAERADVLCIGPGAGRSTGTEQLILRVLAEIDKPTVVDADGLNAIAAAGKLPARKSPLVLTPHPGECGRLLGTDTSSVQADRIAAVENVANKFGAVVVLKGACSLISEKGKIAINSTGNPGMATGGSGDSLTGLIGALLGQGLTAFDSARMGTYVHGRAGDLAAGEIGEIGMIAGDIIEFIPRAIRELEMYG